VDKIWLKTYPSGVPAEIDTLSHQSLVALFEHAFNYFAPLPAFTSMGKCLSFQQIDEKSLAFAAYLQQSLQLKKGDRIAIMLPNILQYPIVLFGALRAGLTVVNVNPLYTQRELEHQLNDAGVKSIVILTNFAHTLAAIHSKTQVKHIIVTELGDCLDFPKKQIVNFTVKYIKKLVPDYDLPFSTPFNHALEQGKHFSFKFQVVDISGDDIAFLQYTGGTTGVAKGAMLTHRNMLSNLRQAELWLDSVLRDGKEVIITALPLYHIFALMANCLLFLKKGALNVFITNPRDIDTFIKTLHQHPFTLMTGVNTLFNALLNHPDFHKVDFSHLRLSLGGGMAVQHAVAEKWQQVTGNILLEAYGLTECCPAVCINPISLTAYNASIGLPLPSTQIKIINADNEEVGLGEAGELCVKGPQVMKGYWKRPEETQLVVNAEGWLRTGDVVTINEEGFVHVVDRKKDMILVSGFNVYPNEIEDVVSEHEGVLEVAAIGIPDEHSGEKVKLFIVAKNPDVTAEDIIAFCRTKLTGYKIPKQVVFLDDLPKSNVGKILRRQLRTHVS